jgi:hypothetical protein
MQTLFRLRSALDTLPQLTEQHKGLANDWVQALYLLSAESELSTGLSIDAAKAKLRIKDNPQILAERYVEFIKVANFGEAEAALMKQAMTFDYGNMSVWLEVGDKVQDAGWEMHNELFALAELWPLLKGNPDLEPLQKWFESIDTDAFVRFGRSMGGRQYSYFTTVLPGDSVQEDLEFYHRFCQQANITPIPEPILNEILNENPDYLEFTLGLSEEGIVFVTLSLPRPSKDFVLKMALVLADTKVQALGIFEGTLGDLDYARFDLTRTGKGIEAAWLYEPMVEVSL